MFEDGQVMLTLPYMKLWCEAKPDDMIELDLFDKVMITANGRVEMDWETSDYEILSRQPNMTGFYFHKNVYAACPNVNAIVHTHSMAISVLSATKDFTIEMVHQNSCRFLHNVAYDRSFGGLATEDEEAQRVAACIGNKEGWRIVWLSTYCNHFWVKYNKGHPLEALTVRLSVNM